MLSLAEMGRRFHRRHNIAGGFDAAAFDATLEKCKVFRTDAGFIAGALAPSWCDPNWLIAIELAWWSEDGAGMRLLRQFEAWAQENGANEIRMTTLTSNPRAAAALRSYEPTETSYRKVL